MLHVDKVSGHTEFISQRLLKKQLSTKAEDVARLVTICTGVILLAMSYLHLFSESHSYLISGLGISLIMSSFVWQCVSFYQKKAEEKRGPSQEQDRLHQAIIEADGIKVQKYIQNTKINLNKAFHLAISKNQLGMADLILAKNLHLINSSNSQGYTALQYALLHEGDEKHGLSRDKIQQALYLIEKGIDVNKCRKGKLPPLFLAIQARSLELVRRLCLRGALDCCINADGNILTAKEFAESQSECRSLSPEINRYFEARAIFKNLITKIKKRRDENRPASPVRSSNVRSLPKLSRTVSCLPPSQKSAAIAKKAIKIQKSTRLGTGARLVTAAVGAILLVIGSLNLLNSTYSYFIGALGGGFKLASILWQISFSYRSKLEHSYQSNIAQYHLHEAILEAEGETVRQIIKRKKSKVDVTMAFHFAIVKNQFGMADIILEGDKTLIDSPFFNNHTALQYALLGDTKGNLSTDKKRQALYLIEREANVNKCAEETLPPLFLAIRIQSLDLIRSLRGQGANDSILYQGKLLTPDSYIKEHHVSEDIVAYFARHTRVKQALKSTFWHKPRRGAPTPASV